MWFETGLFFNILYFCKKISLLICNKIDPTSLFASRSVSYNFMTVQLYDNDASFYENMDIIRHYSTNGTISNGLYSFVIRFLFSWRKYEQILFRCRFYREYGRNSSQHCHFMSSQRFDYTRDMNQVFVIFNEHPYF